MPGLYSHTTRSAGTVLTANIYNADHQNHIDNLEPDTIDDYSVNLAQFQGTTDPGELATESLPTSLAGELERLRYAIKETKQALNGSLTQWYQSPVSLRTANVKSYGAVGDDSTNDTVAIQAALDDTTYTTIFFPAGTYKVEELTFTRGGIQLIGEPGATLKVRSPLGPNYKILTLPSGTDSVTIRGLSFNGASSAADEAIYFGLIDATDCALVTVESCNFTLTGGWAIVATDCAGTLLRDNYVTSVARGFFLHASTADGYGERVIGNQLLGVAGGYVVTVAPPSAIHLSAASPFQHRGAVIQGNAVTMNGGEMGIVVDKSSGAQTNTGGVDCAITGNTVIGDGAAKFGISGIFLNSTITGNTIRGVISYGIECHGEGNAVVANTITAALVSGGGGIFVGDAGPNPQHIIIADNVIDGTGSASVGPRGILLFQNTTTMKNITIRGNHISKCETLIYAQNSSRLNIVNNWLAEPAGNTPRFVWIVQASGQPDNAGSLIMGNCFTGTGARAGVRLQTLGAAVIDSLYVTSNNTTGMVTVTGGMDIPGVTGQITNLLVANNHGADPTNPLKNLIWP